MRSYWTFDDALDVFAMHGIAGIVGMVLTVCIEGVYYYVWYNILN